MQTHPVIFVPKSSLPPVIVRFPTLLLFLLIGTAASGQSAEALLADSTLSGWHVIMKGEGSVPVDSQRHFVWEDSLLHILPDAVAGSRQPFAALITDSTYRSYTLTLEYRWGDKKFAPRTDAPRDAGILFHAQENTAFWPTSLEYQIQENDTGDTWLIGTRAVSLRGPDGKVFDPSGTPARRTGNRYVRFTRRPATELPGWNVVRIVVDGQQAQFYLNGELVNAITDAQWRPVDDEIWEPLAEGHIALQAEGAEVFYRRIALRRLE
ncbi:DUF1080 domain-containing protein [Lewinella sp. IMCC34191]|uniref:3-keto-disaccharide hydrolase n=1 Tax=Lewinella sp. IMCC34191 TaxID=2259172 RepID=UPI000E2794F2|nr:DUF1080 domain-containing protein [Lewinella sp. IMCC34191]